MEHLQDLDIFDFFFLGTIHSFSNNECALFMERDRPFRYEVDILDVCAIIFGFHPFRYFPLIGQAPDSCSRPGSTITEIDSSYHHI